jgi:DNA-binding beta-propeller fold protein YncE
MKTILLLALASSLLASATAQDKNGLSLTKTIPLPDVPGGFNHMSYDASHHRVFLTATTKKTVEIIDVQAGKPERTLSGDGPAAALFAPEFNQLYVTRAHNVCIYDGATFDLRATIDLQSSLDELQYSPSAKELYAGCMTSNKTAIAIIALPEGKRKGEIKLPAKPQGFIAEHKGTRIFVNTPAPKQVVVLDAAQQKLLHQWALKDAAGNYPVAVDETNHRIFVGCRRPSELLVLDSASGNKIASVPISNDTDDLSFDPNKSRVYIACGSGFIDVVAEAGPNKWSSLQKLPTRDGARNCCFSPELNEFYLAVPAQDNQPAELRVYQSK